MHGRRLALLLIGTAALSGVLGAVLAGARPGAAPSPLAAGAFDPEAVAGQATPGQVARRDLPADLVAVVDGEPIHRADLLAMVADELASDWLVLLVNRRLLAAEAQRLGVYPDEATLESHVARLAGMKAEHRFHGKREQLATHLAQTGQSETEWKDQFENQALDQLLGPAVARAHRDLGDAVLQAEWQRRHGAKGIRRTVRHLLVSTDPERSGLYAHATWQAERQAVAAEAREIARDLLEQLRGGGDLAALAAAHQGGPAGLQSGNLGAGWRGRLGDAFDRVVDGLAPGEVAAKPVESKFGAHAIRCDGIREAWRVTWQEVSFAAAPPVISVVGDAAKVSTDPLAAARAKAQAFTAAVAQHGAQAALAALPGDVVVTAHGPKLLSELQPPALRQTLSPLASGAASEPGQRGSSSVVLVAVSRERQPEHDERLVSHVLVGSDYRSAKRRKLAGDLTARARARADEILAEALADPQRLEFHARYSNDDQRSRKAAGLVDALDLRRHGAALSAALDGLEAGGQPQLVPDAEGVHVVRLERVEETSFESVREALETELRGRLPTRPEILRSIAVLRSRARIVITTKIDLGD